MQTFKEFSFQDEAVTMATRMKMKAAMRKNKAKIKLGRKKAAKKLASPEKLKQRSRKQARELIIKKLLKDKKKADLSYAARQDLEKRVAKKQGAILKISKSIIGSLNYKGIICIEFFIDNNNNILVNEIAPRTHNSGHYSIEGCDISQFEHQVKILTNQEPKYSNLKNSSVMLNLLGDLWSNNDPDFSTINKENIFLHLYNKDIAKPGRKMGHITVIDKSIDNAEQIVDKLFNSLI